MGNELASSLNMQKMTEEPGVIKVEFWLFGEAFFQVSVVWLLKEYKVTGFKYGQP